MITAAFFLNRRMLLAGAVALALLPFVLALWPKPAPPEPPTYCERSFDSQPGAYDVDDTWEDRRNAFIAECEWRGGG